MAAQQRPLSPHLTIYSPQLTSILSILHRATGVLLAMGAFALVAWLLAVAGDGPDFVRVQMALGAPLGMLCLAALLVALVYHFLNGVRHLLWDIGWGYEIPRAYASGYLVVALTVVLTGAILYLGWHGGRS